MHVRSYAAIGGFFAGFLSTCVCTDLLFTVVYTCVDGLMLCMYAYISMCCTIVMHLRRFAKTVAW